MSWQVENHKRRQIPMLRSVKDKLRKTKRWERGGETAVSRRGGSETKVHYLINLTAAAWNAQSDGSLLMQRAGVIYHGERRLTLSLSTPLTFINSPLKDSLTLLGTHTHHIHKHVHTKDLRLNGKTLKRRQSINRDTGAFNNLIFQAQLGPPRLVSPTPSIKRLWRVSVVWKDNFKMSGIRLIQFSGPPVCHC